MEQAQNAHDWADEKQSPVTIDELDAAVKAYMEKREAYEAAKKVSTEKYKEAELFENKMVELMTRANKKTYKAEGVGTVTRVFKSVVTTPKDIQAKRELFDWIRKAKGEVVLNTLLSINHQTLNGFYNQEIEANAENPLFKIPGIEAPTSMETVSFRRG